MSGVVVDLTSITRSAAAWRFGQTVRRLREGRGWRGAELARRAGLSSSRVFQVERANSRPSAPVALALFAALELDRTSAAALLPLVIISSFGTLSSSARTYLSWLMDSVIAGDCGRDRAAALTEVEPDRRAFVRLARITSEVFEGDSAAAGNWVATLLPCELVRCGGMSVSRWAIVPDGRTVKSAVTDGAGRKSALCDPGCWRAALRLIAGGCGAAKAWRKARFSARRDGVMWLTQRTFSHRIAVFSADVPGWRAVLAGVSR